jgi:hypothetical protein
MTTESDKSVGRDVRPHASALFQAVKQTIWLQEAKGYLGEQDWHQANRKHIENCRELVRLIDPTP